jgi:hypothetical protein
MPTIDVPDHWFLITPDGEVDGSIHGISPGGRNVRATAEQAHAFFTPLKRSRDKEIRDGWTVRPATHEELLAEFGGGNSHV